MAKKLIPDTSIDAYKSLVPEEVGKTYLAIVGALFILKKGTFEDIASHLKIDKSRVWKRLSEMEGMEMICRPGTKKKLQSGRQGYEWELTSKWKPTIQGYSRNIQSISKQIQLKLL